MRQGAECCTLPFALPCGGPERLLLFAFGPLTARERTAHLSTAAGIERSTQVRHRVELDQAVQQLPSPIETHVIPPSTGTGAGALNFTCVPQWIQRGYDLALAYLSSALPLHQQATVAVVRAVGCADANRIFA